MERNRSIEWLSRQLRRPSSDHAALRAVEESKRDLNIFLFGYGVSMVGTGMVPVALSFAVLAEGRSTKDVGLVLAAQTVPLVALLLLGGVVADRSRKAVMIAADVLRCITESLLAIVFMTGKPSMLLVMLLAAGLGVGQAFFNPALTGLLPQLTSASSLYRANALKSVVSSSGQLIGPALAGLIIATYGAGCALAVDAATYAVSAVCLLSIRSRPPLILQRKSMFSELRSGWKEFTSRSWLWVIVVQFGLFRMMVYGPFLVLGAVIARDSGGGASSWGLILSAQGAGSLIGGLSIGRFRPRHPLSTATLATFAFALPVACLALRAPEGVTICGSALSGLGISIFVTLWESTLQLEIPTHVLSRVAAYDWLGSYAFIPVGYVLAGIVSDHLGVRVTLALSTIWALLSSAVVISIPSVRRLRAVR